MTKQPHVEFFIDTFNKAAYQHIQSIISVGNVDDVDEKYNVHIVNIQHDDETSYFHLKGSWEAYKTFLHPHGVNTKDPKNQYSLTHYQE
jgi:hypothetical protein